MKKLLSMLCLMGIVFAFQTRLIAEATKYKITVVNGTADMAEAAEGEAKKPARKTAAKKKTAEE